MFRRILVHVVIPEPGSTKQDFATAAHLADPCETEVRLIYVIPFLIDAALEYLPKNFFAREGEQPRSTPAKAQEVGLQDVNKLCCPVRGNSSPGPRRS